MRKLIVIFTILGQLLLLLGATPAYAYSVEANTFVAQDIQIGNNFTFEQLGFDNAVMVGPYDLLNIRFSLPANTALASGGYFSIKFAASGASYLGENVNANTNTNTNINENWLGGTLLVYFNNVLIDTIVLDTLGEEIAKDIDIPTTALLPDREDGRHELQLVLAADLHCDITDTILLISKDSGFSLQYQTVSPVKDLSLLPQPFYQPDSILPSKGYIVVPDNPEDYELQAAMNIAAGLGSMSEGRLDLSLVTNSALSPDIQSSNHLIYVGLASNFSNLQNADFPVAITTDGLNLDSANSEDGIIQIGESPWSPSFVAAFVGGNSETAVVKAAKAFSVGRIVAVEKPDVSFISSVNSPNNDALVAEDITFEDLGYETIRMGLFGDNYITYNFYASAEQAASTGAYIELVVAHSDLINRDATGITILLNDETIGGVRLEDESPETIQIKMIPDVLRRGINRLEIITDIVPYYTCYSTDLLSNWITISNTSRIHIPVSLQQIETGTKMDLNDFPYMLLNDRTLNDVAFVLAKDDPISWEYASKVAASIGAKGSVPLVNMSVAFADAVPDTILSNYNLLIFGRASNLPIISQLNDALPAPFSEGSDEAIQPEMLVNYSVLSTTDVGYLELTSSPYSTDKYVITILGNTDAGIPMASTALTTDDLVSQLSGNFAILYADQVVTTDTRLGISGNQVVQESTAVSGGSPTLDPEQDIPGTSDEELNIESRPAWILPVFIVITALILILLVVMLRRESKSRVAIEEDSDQAN